jgi:hypothetical protein
MSIDAAALEKKKQKKTNNYKEISPTILSLYGCEALHFSLVSTAR